MDKVSLVLTANSSSSMIVNTPLRVMIHPSPHSFGHANVRQELAAFVSRPVRFSPWIETKIKLSESNPLGIIHILKNLHVAKNPVSYVRFHCPITFGGVKAIDLIRIKSSP
jgi:hypothetical protein